VPIIFALDVPSQLKCSKSLKRKKRFWPLETFYNTMGPLPRSWGENIKFPLNFNPCASKGKISSSSK